VLAAYGNREKFEKQPPPGQEAEEP
jgi:hypothetical protein